MLRYGSLHTASLSIVRIGHSTIQELKYITFTLAGSTVVIPRSKKVVSSVFYFIHEFYRSYLESTLYCSKHWWCIRRSYVRRLAND